MTGVTGQKSIPIPQNAYYAPINKQRENHSSEDHIVPYRPFIGARIALDKALKLPKYVKDGISGSSNGNFYQYLSMGMVPYLTGSVMLMALYGALNKHFNPKDAAAATKGFKKMAGGVILYGLGKLIGSKALNLGVNATTGINMDLAYKKVVPRFPEYKGDPETSRVEFHKVFESTEYPRWDLLEKLGEKKHNDLYYWSDKIGQRIGLKQNSDDPRQEVYPRVKGVITRATAANRITPYFWAATGVALAAQKPFESFMKFPSGKSFGQKARALPGEIVRVLKESAVDLWRGGTKGNTRLSSKILGRGLVCLAAGTTLLGILFANKDYRIKNQKESKVDFNKSHEVL